MAEPRCSSRNLRSHHRNRRMAQVRIHRLQMIELFEQPGPVVIVGFGRDGRAEITVKRENIASELLRQFRVVALQLVQ